MTGLLAAGLGAALVALAALYAGKRRGALLLGVPLFVAADTWLSALLLLPAHPVLFALLATALVFLPMLALAVAVLDARFGLFPLDVFYGLLLTIAGVPLHYAVNLLLLAVGAGGG
ncbi:MAG: hypothetical protein L0216_12595 [Planctomycetales bacterium]|nr:hypothetical protein [Planctomycetales bacterium]